MKYKLTTNFIKQNGKKLYQIQSLKNFSDVKVGELGGYIESEKNLAQEGDCWILDEAKVYGNAKVFRNARISGYAIVSGNARISGYAIVSDYAIVSGEAKVLGDGNVCGNLLII